jgi:hypothetical protein
MRGSPVPQRRHMGLCGAGAAEVLSAVLPKTKSLFWAYKKGQIMQDIIASCKACMAGAAHSGGRASQIRVLPQKFWLDTHFPC